MRITTALKAKISLFLLLSVISCCAQAVRVTGNASVSGNTQIMALPVPAATCANMAFTNGAAQADFDSSTTASFMGEFKVVFSTATNICSLTFNTTLASSVNFHASIWTIDASNNLLAQQGSYSGTVTGNGSQQNNTFSFSSPVSLSGSTQYALVFSKTDNSALTLVTQLYRSTDVVVGVYEGRWVAAGTLENFSSNDALMFANSP